MSKGIAKILSGLLVFGMVGGLYRQYRVEQCMKAEGESDRGDSRTEEENVPHIHCECGTGELSAESRTNHHTTQTWTGIDDLSKIKVVSIIWTKDITINSVWDCPSGVELCLNGHSITRNTEAIDGSLGGNAVIRINENTSFAPLRIVRKTVWNYYSCERSSGEGVYNAGFFIMYNGKISVTTVVVLMLSPHLRLYDGMIKIIKHLDLRGGVYVSDSGG